MKKISLLSVMLLAIFVLSGCLTSQYKEYKFHFTGNNEGTLTITYVNIYSQIYDDEDIDSVLGVDYSSVVTDYISGEEVEKDYPNAKVISKRLFEKNGQLCGELVLEFKDATDVHLFKYDKKSPWMFYMVSDETFFDSNGEKSADYMPVVFWDRKVKDDLELSTLIREPKDTDRSLLSTWKANK